MRRGALATIGGAALLLAVTLVSFAGTGTSTAAPLDPKVKPDATLSSGESIVFKSTEQLLGAEQLYHPSACRGEAATPDEAIAPLTCKAYRIALNLDADPKALNAVYVQADFDQTQIQSLPIVAAGLNPPPVNGLDIYVWDLDDHYLGQNAPGVLDPVVGPGDPDDQPPGGSGFSEPERGSWVAKQKLYDVTIQASAGVLQGYNLRLAFSNNIFAKPFELLEEFTKPVLPDEKPPAADSPVAGGAAPPSVVLPTADIAPDGDIAGIGLGVTEQFDSDQFALPPQTRTIAAAKPPSGVALVFAMVALPLALAAATFVFLQRRQQAFLT